MASSRMKRRIRAVSSATAGRMAMRGIRRIVPAVDAAPLRRPHLSQIKRGPPAEWLTPDCMKAKQILLAALGAAGLGIGLAGASGVPDGPPVNVYAETGAGKLSAAV